jgi:hypothetical protein
MDAANVAQSPAAVNHVIVQEDRRRRVCLRKCRYPTIAKALRALNRATSRGEKHLGIYRCEFCSCYHLGHTPRNLRP